MKRINLIFFFYLILTIFCFNNNLKAEKSVKIKFYIGNEIITNVDIFKEQNYLTALNNNLKNISKKQLYQIAEDSIIREKIKKNELLKFFDFNLKDNTLERITKNFYKRLNLNSLEEFDIYLKKYDLRTEEIKQKLYIEAKWNELVFRKYKNQVTINEEKLKKKIKNQKNILTEYNLSEILFEIKSGEKLTPKHNKILNNIKSSGFENSANLFSISDSSKFGGNLGWVNENQLNETLLKIIKQLDLNEFTNPIQTANGYLIVRLNKKREKEIKIDFNNEFKRALSRERNRQLNQFSLIYYNKIKQNIFISEK